MTPSRTHGQPARAPARNWVNLLLDRPDLPAVVRSLAAPALADLVREIGLADAGEFVALASPEQLGALLDDDVWRADRPGEEEAFDAVRFGLWLEILADLGPVAAAERLAAMDEPFVAYAFSRLLHVFDSARLEEHFELVADRRAQAAFDKAAEGRLSWEFDAWWVVARAEEGWDALLDILTTLAERHAALFERLMHQCARATDAAAEDEGSYADLLAADEALLEDAAGAREERRMEAGYVAPRTARSFLRVLEDASADAILAEKVIDPVVDTYLHPLRSPLPTEAFEAAPMAEGDAREFARRLTGFLASLQEGKSSADRRLVPAALENDGPGTGFVQAMRALTAEDMGMAFARRRELAFLANALVSGESKQGRRMTLPEAAEAAVSTCERGMQRLAGRDPKRAATILREDLGAVYLFRLGRARG